MDATERTARAEEAERLMSSRLLKEAFDDFEKQLTERILQAPTDPKKGDEIRRRAADAVMVCRNVRKYLKNVAAEGKVAAANAAREIAPQPRNRWLP